MTTSIEDNNQRILYQGQWSRIRSSSASGGTFIETTDSRASLTLGFTGTQITVLCAVRTRNGSEGGVIVSIDNGAPQQVYRSSPSNGQNPDGLRPCWTSSTLSPSPHILMIRMIGDVKFLLDRIDFVAGDPPAPSGVPPSTLPVPGGAATVPSISPPDVPQPSPPATVTVILSNNPQVNSSPDPTQSLSDVSTAIPSTPLTNGYGSPIIPLSFVAADPSSSTDYAAVFSSILATDTGGASAPTSTPKHVTVPSSVSAERSKARIVGGVLGSLLALLLLGLLTYFALKRRKKKQLLEDEAESTYGGHNDNNYENLPSPIIRAHDPTAVTPYNVAPSQTQYYASNPWPPVSHAHHPDNQRPRPASFSSSMYTDGPPLRAP